MMQRIVQSLRLLAAGLAFLAPLPAAADAVDDLVLAEMDKEKIPGLSLAVVRNGRLELGRAYGMANLEHRVPATPETVFQIQSITKSFTAAGIMLLAEEGKVDLAAPIGTYLEGLPELWAPVTVRHLLSHTSGIKDFINEPTVNLRLDVSPEDVIRSVEELPLNFPTGERYGYSNTGYHLLGMIIRAVSGQSFEAFLHDRFFVPLGMRDTRRVDLSKIVSGRASGYVLRQGELHNGQFVAPSILGYAGGGMVSTVLDLAKWEIALSEGRVLKPETLAQCWTPAKLNGGAEAPYGFGWAIGWLGESRAVGHGGAHVTGFHTDILRCDDLNLSVIVLTNRFGCNPNQIARRVAALLDERARPKPPPPSPEERPKEQP
jgi:D-alanyl-D-alanine carboxypeptidase